MRVSTPRMNLEAFKTLNFRYYPEDDTAFLHIDGPRPAITEEVDDGWYLRLTGDENEVVGMELHGLLRVFLSERLFSDVFTPAREELEKASGKGFTEGLSVKGSVFEFPRTAQFLIFMIGQATARYQAMQRGGAMQWLRMPIWWK